MPTISEQSAGSAQGKASASIDLEAFHSSPVVDALVACGDMGALTYTPSLPGATQTPTPFETAQRSSQSDLPLQHGAARCAATVTHNMAAPDNSATSAANTKALRCEAGSAPAANVVHQSSSGMHQSGSGRHLEDPDITRPHVNFTQPDHDGGYPGSSAPQTLLPIELQRASDQLCQRLVGGRQSDVNTSHDSKVLPQSGVAVRQ